MKKFCPVCEEMLMPTANGQAVCKGCGWAGGYGCGITEPKLPETPYKLPYVSIDIETTGLDPETCQTLEVGAVIDDWKSPIDQLPRFRRVFAYETVCGSPMAMSINATLLKLIANAPKEPKMGTDDAIAKWVEQFPQESKHLAGAIRQFVGDFNEVWWSLPLRILLVEGMSRRPDSEIFRLAANPPGISCFCEPADLGPLFRSWLTAYGMDPKSVQAAGKNFASFDARFLEKIPDFSKYIKFRHRIIDPAILFWNPAEDERLPDSKTCSERAGGDGKVAHTAIDDALEVVRMIRMGVKKLL
ncbi:MAG: hypothetical protein ABFC88_12455 [Thermoguttaceae bacterium]